MEVAPQITLGAGGRNGNFAVPFTVPASMTVVGYARGGPSTGTAWYRSIDLEGARTGSYPSNRRTALVPAAKMAAVKAVLDGTTGIRWKFEGTPLPWSSAPGDATSKLPGAVSLRLFLAPPGTGRTVYDLAAVNALLASLHTAITT